MTLPNTSIPAPRTVDLLQPTRLRGRNVVVPLYRTLDARALFAVLNDKREASRPISEKKVFVGHDRIGRRRFRKEAVFGDPTFRNVLVKNEATGKTEHV